MATNKRITLHLRGPDGDNGDVRFDDFIKQLNSVKHALSETERILSDQSSVYFKVVDLRHNSPASVVLEAVPVNGHGDNSQIVVNKFFSSLDDIERETAPSGFDFNAFQAFKEMTSLIGKQLTEFSVSRNGDQPKILTSLAGNVDRILGPDEYEMGSITGVLEQINVHANQNVFVVYPTSNQPKLKCIFPQELRAQAVHAVDQYVKIYGQMKYKTYLRGDHPYEMLVKQIEIYPAEDTLPTLGELEGIAPNSIGELTSEEFIRKLRYEW